MSEGYITIPVSAFFCKPFIREYFVRMFDGNRDITPEVDHIANRMACRMANERNAAAAKRFGVAAPYYHYDALSGKALALTAPPPPEAQG